MQSGIQRAHALTLNLALGIDAAQLLGGQGRGFGQGGNPAVQLAQPAAHLGQVLFEIDRERPFVSRSGFLCRDMLASLGQRGFLGMNGYFTEQVAPHVDGDRVVYLGSVGPGQRAEILGSSAALLHPIAFDEPFGLSVVESMACGTPVIAYRRGSMPEVVDEGVTGFLVHDAGQAREALERITMIDRAGCRTRARQRFGVDRMVNEYLRVYATILG